MNIERLSTADVSAYRELIARAPDAMLYHAPEFHRFLARTAGGAFTTFVACDGNAWHGALTIAQREAGGGTVVNSLPWYGSHGGCVVAADAPDSTRPALLAAYRDYLDSQSLLAATLILSPWEQRHVELYREILQPTTLDQRIGQLTRLPDACSDLDEALLAMCLQKTRNVVRKSLRQEFDGIVSDDDAAWQFLFETHAENMQVIGGRAKPWDHFVALRETLPPEQRRLYLARDGGEIVAAVLLLYFGRTVEYITPVIRHEARPRQPLTYLIFQAMRDAVAAGYQYWNWGGTWVNQQSLHHFKQGFGAVDHPYTYLIHLGRNGLAPVIAHRATLGNMYPWYYVYPHDQLPVAAA